MLQLQEFLSLPFGLSYLISRPKLFFYKMNEIKDIIVPAAKAAFQIGKNKAILVLALQAASTLGK